jgi:hypothetical protein
MSVRADIKTKIQALLMGQTIAESRVFKSPYPVLADGETQVARPYLCVFIDSEQVEQDFDVETDRRTDSVVVECVCEDMDDLDALSDSVEYILRQSETLYGIVDKIKLNSGAFGAVDADLHSPVMSWVMRYSAVYYGSNFTDSSALSDFDTDDIRYTNFNAGDKIILPQGG